MDAAVAGGSANGAAMESECTKIGMHTYVFFHAFLQRQDQKSMDVHLVSDFYVLA